MSLPPSTRRGVPALALAATAFLWSPAARAHGFGQRYDLPMPLELYLMAAAAAVLLSFLVMALVAGRSPGKSQRKAPLLVLLDAATVTKLAPLRLVARLFVLFLFALALAAGFWGTPDPFKNLIPTLIWVIWWVGLAFVSALVGDIWAWLNPLSTAFDGLRAAMTRVAPGLRQALRRPYPKKLASWPAVALLTVFFWLELVWDGGDRPADLAGLVLAYALITWLGMLVFGKRTWLRNGEAFTLTFGFFARCAPLCFDSRRGALCLRPPLGGLRQSERLRHSDMALLLVLLAGVSFDGLKETPLWANLWIWILETTRESGLGDRMAASGIDLFTLVSTLALLALPWLLAAVYGLFSLLMATAAALFGGDRIATDEIARSFVLALLPIAVGYHIAHYLSYLLVTGQWIIPLLSDPFGFGWDLFGTAGYRVDIAVIGARFAWNAAVAAIVFGHIAAVWLAHHWALARFADRAAALRSQVPMLALMLAYTVGSLWLVAQPIVEIEG